MDIFFHVCDNCNMKCPNCHWFFEEVRPMSKIKAEDIVNFLKRVIREKIEIERIFFSGGEPTLWPGLAEAINRIPAEITDIRLFTNGSLPEKLKNIDHHLSLRISIHNNLNWDKIKECVDLALFKNWDLRFVGYEGAIEEIECPRWFKHDVVIKKEQISESKKTLSHVVGRKIKCQPHKVYFGTDGRAYFCEKGLRTKKDKYAEDFDLWSGKPKIRSKVCEADWSCISNIINEQDYEII